MLKPVQIFTMVLMLIVAGCGGGSSNTSDTPTSNHVFLGSYQTSFFPETGEAFTESIDPAIIHGNDPKYFLSAKTAQTSTGHISAANCSIDFNPTTLWLSWDASIQNVTASSSYANIVLVVVGFDNLPNNFQIINTNSPGNWYLSQNDVNADGIGDNFYPAVTLAVANNENQYGWNGFNLGADNILSPSEVSGCKFLQINVASSTPFNLYWDSWGDDTAGAPAAPTLNAVTTPTNSATQNLTGTCVTGAAMAITGGATTATGTCVASAYNISVTLNTNTTNNLAVTQTSGGFTSPPANGTIVHDNIAPQVSSNSPVNNETLVSIFENIVVNFNEPMKLSTFVDRTTVFLDRNGACGAQVVNGTISLSGDLRQLVFNPTASLTANCTYTFQVYGTGQVNNSKDLANNALNASLSVNFTTAATTNDKTPPQVLSVYPTDNARDIARSSFFSIRFSEAMDTSTFTLTNCNTSGALKNIALVDESNGSGTGVVTTTLVINGDGSRVDIYPQTLPLSASTEYSIIISSCIKDLAGNTLALMGKEADGAFAGTQSYNSFGLFTTSASSDTTAPTLDKVIPNLGSTSVPLTVSPYAIFSEPIDPNTILDANTYFTIQGSSAHLATVLRQSSSGQAIIFEPLSTLSTNTSYVTHYDATLTDFSGNGLSSPQTSSFTSATTGSSVTPTVIATLPVTGATNQSPYSNFVVYFSTPMKATSFSGSNVTFSQGGTGLIKDVILSDDGYKMTIVPGLFPLSNATYTVALNPVGISPQITDKSGNVLANSSYTFTVSADATAPTLTSIVPADAATGIPTTSIVQMLFSEKLDVNFLRVQDPSGLQATNEFRTCTGCNASASGGTTLWTFPSTSEDNRVITLNVYSSMANSTLHRVLIKQNGARDQTGNKFATNTVKSFTTSAAIDSTAPTVSSVPANNATNIAVTSDLVFTFNEAMDYRTINKDNLIFYDQTGNIVSTDLTFNTTFTQFTLDTKSNLRSGGCYYWVVTTGVRDAGGGNRLATTQSGKFSTGASACP